MTGGLHPHNLLVRVLVQRKADGLRDVIGFDETEPRQEEATSDKGCRHKSRKGETATFAAMDEAISSAEPQHTGAKKHKSNHRDS